MKSLYLRVWLTIVALLALFALVASLLVRQEFVRERGRFDALAAERAEAWADLIERSLPGANAPREEQAQAVREWSQRLGLPLALDDARGERVVESESFVRRAGAHDRGAPRLTAVTLDDGRRLWVVGARAFVPPRLPRAGRDDGERAERRMPPGVSTELARAWPWPQGVGLVFVLGLLFIGVAAGAYPVVRRLTRRLEALQRGVEGFGSGDLTRRVDDTGKDEVASVARAFNDAAQRVETLLRSNQSLLANASHELRSPLARLKMAVSMLEPDLPPARRQQLEREIHTNIGELDALVDEVLLASRLDAQHKLDKHERVDLRAIVAEEAARTGVPAVPEGAAVVVPGDERLLRRAVRNLLENARRYGGGSVEAGVEATVAADSGARIVEVRIADRGPGVPADMRERIFEPFFRLPGHAEREGGVGLGLSLVRQIAQRHGGSVRVDGREGGGSVFVLSIPSSGGAGT
jgi:signal transduction histidine kinase